ncbi:hypothetical protein FB45DRAFT_918154 [Roridomyces roridus]|uniref:Uncharacterized protein n=1 Tax=Roridomyces roridus TaxID=1738132 RepID=A0AAD7FJM3_9AGAR|nr:hypothetical protein FB45DRAFT_918154 [Roridomyces roridus]
MTSWMLVSREWLSIVVPIFLRDVWFTSQSLIMHLSESCLSPGLAYRLAGITNLRQYLAENSRSLTISIYQKRTTEYRRQCTELAEYAADPTCECIVAGLCGPRKPYYGIPPKMIASTIHTFFPNIKSLHFVLVDCLPTLWYWDMDFLLSPSLAQYYPDCLTDLHITFAYTCPPPPLLVGAPRGTFYPLRSSYHMPHVLNFTAVERLVVREANADFVAFFTTVCPRLECIESTAEFGAEDLPPEVATKLGDRMVSRRLATTTEWGIKGSDIRPEEEPLSAPCIPKQNSPANLKADTRSPITPKKIFMWPWRTVRRLFRLRL